MFSSVSLDWPRMFLNTLPNRWVKLSNIMFSLWKIQVSGCFWWAAGLDYHKAAWNPKNQKNTAFYHNHTPKTPHSLYTNLSTFSGCFLPCKSSLKTAKYCFPSKHLIRNANTPCTQTYPHLFRLLLPHYHTKHPKKQPEIKSKQPKPINRV